MRELNQVNIKTELHKKKIIKLNILKISKGWFNVINKTEKKHIYRMKYECDI